MWAQLPMCEHVLVVNAECLSRSPSHFLRQGFSLNLELSDWPVWMAIKLQGSSHFCLPSARMSDPTFCVGSGDLNSSLHTCLANTLLTGSTVWPLPFYFDSLLLGAGALNRLYLRSYYKFVHLLMAGNFLIIYNNVFGNIQL